MSMNKLKKSFPEFYQEKLHPKDLNNDKNNIIVFDTNYLLDILRYPTNVATKYLDALNKVSNNIYIPYLVALEFNFQKSNIKKRKKQQIDDYKNHIDNSFSKLLENINKIELVNEPTEKKQFTASLIEETEDFHSTLKSAIEEKIETTITKEEQGIYERLISIIGNKIGDKYDQDEIDIIEKDGETRYEQGVPPGFNDDDKGSNDDPIRSYGDIKYQRKYGDLIIWMDIIKYSKTVKGSSKVIFVTNDGTSNKKHDLMYRVGTMTVGPHISLLNEIKTKANKDLYILSNLNFIQQASKLSDAEIDTLKVSTSLQMDTEQEEFDKKFLQELFDKLLTIDAKHPDERLELSQLLKSLSRSEVLQFLSNEKKYRTHIDSLITYINKSKNQTFVKPSYPAKDSTEQLWTKQNRGGWTHNFGDEVQ